MTTRKAEKSMISHTFNQQSGQSKNTKIRATTNWALVVLFALCGVVLLVAEKTVAGISCTLSGLVLALPLQRLIAKRRHLLWGRAITVAILLVVVVQSIAGTDLRPEQRITGNAAIDKVSAIVEDFRDTLSGKKGGSNPAGKNEITKETAEKLTACMRDHGLANLPDPELNEDGISFDFSRVNASQETIRAAQEACKYIMTTSQ